MKFVSFWCGDRAFGVLDLPRGVIITRECEHMMFWMCHGDSDIQREPEHLVFWICHGDPTSTQECAHLVFWICHGDFTSTRECE